MIKPGEYVLALAGHDATPTEGFLKSLAGQAGKPVEVLDQFDIVGCQPQRVEPRPVEGDLVVHVTHELPKPAGLEFRKIGARHRLDLGSEVTTGGVQARITLVTRAQPQQLLLVLQGCQPRARYISYARATLATGSREPPRIWNRPTAPLLFRALGLPRDSHHTMRSATPASHG